MFSLLAASLHKQNSHAGLHVQVMVLSVRSMHTPGSLVWGRVDSVPLANIPTVLLVSAATFRVSASHASS